MTIETAFLITIVIVIIVVMIAARYIKAPVVVHETLARQHPYTASTYVQSVILVALQERQLTREEILSRCALFATEDRVDAILKCLVLQGKISANNGSNNPTYVLCASSGLDVI